MNGKRTMSMSFLQGVFEYLEKQGKAPAPVGLQVMLHGQVPTGASHPHADSTTA